MKTSSLTMDSKIDKIIHEYNHEKVGVFVRVRTRERERERKREEERGRERERMCDKESESKGRCYRHECACYL